MNGTVINLLESPYFVNYNQPIFLVIRHDHV